MNDLYWIVACGVLGAAIVGLLVRVAKDRAKLRQTGLFVAFPVPPVEPGDLDPDLELTPLGPTLSTEVRFIAPLKVRGGVSPLESWILCVLARHAKRIFEFGTCTGLTTYLLARNSPRDANVCTLTLAPSQLADYHRGPGDSASETRAALKESSHERFYYGGTEVESKIVQHCGDSKQFDDRPYEGKCDLVFVDGSHARSYVENDSAKALRMVAPGGLVLWHDYRGPWQARGVFRALNKLSRRLPLRHVKGTTLVFYRRPL